MSTWDGKSSKMEREEARSNIGLPAEVEKWREKLDESLKQACVDDILDGELTNWPGDSNRQYEWAVELLRLIGQQRKGRTSREEAWQEIVDRVERDVEASVEHYFDELTDQLRSLRGTYEADIEAAVDDRRRRDEALKGVLVG